MDIHWLINFAILIFGFGFVIFWHELGHFLAAKWAGVKVEQFAVGFGQAIVSFRKGLGVRVGSTGKTYLERAKEAVAESGRDPERASAYELDEAAAGLGLSPTEYRLNWMPLGGYVKMLGQDDLRPGEFHEDPRSYNKASVGKRMVIISAGVVMNVILAAALFWGLFTVGFNSPPPVIGSVSPGSPAQAAGLRVGDELVRFDGDVMHDFTKINLAVPLSTPDEPVQVTFLRDGQEMTATITPEAGGNGMTRIGIGQTPALVGPGGAEIEAIREAGLEPLLLADERIVAVDGVEVDEDDYRVLHRAAQIDGGSVITLTVRSPDGSERSVEVEPMLERNADGIHSVGGLLPRVKVVGIVEGRPADGRLEMDDVIVSMRRTGMTDVLTDPTAQEVRDTIALAGRDGATLDVTVLRGGEPMEIAAMPVDSLGGGQYGLGFLIGYDPTPLVAGVGEGPLAKAGVPAGATVAAVDGEPVAGWEAVDRIVRRAGVGETLTLMTTSGETYTLTPDEAQVAVLSANTYSPIDRGTGLFLTELKRLRKADNPGQAIWWGVTETRDLVLKFYLTLKQIAVGNVSANNLNGPVGIIHAGTILSGKGTDWMVWFLGLISANLAVVNFLPLPLVDGGHFCFLLWEKFTGKPASAGVQFWTQLAGLALFAGLFLFVTYNDVSRLLL